jgi:hypothetical protein
MQAAQPTRVAASTTASHLEWDLFRRSSMTKSPVARLRTERGVTTAEYAVVTAAGCGFASVLIKLLTSEWGQRLLKTLFDLIMKVIGI